MCIVYMLMCNVTVAVSCKPHVLSDQNYVLEEIEEK